MYTRTSQSGLNFSGLVFRDRNGIHFLKCSGLARKRVLTRAIDGLPWRTFQIRVSSHLWIQITRLGCALCISHRIGYILRCSTDQLDFSGSQQRISSNKIRLSKRLILLPDCPFFKITITSINDLEFLLPTGLLNSCTVKRNHRLL